MEEKKVKNETPNLARKMKGKKVSKEHDRKGPGRPKQMALTTFSCPRVNKKKEYTHYAENIGIEGEPNQDVKWNKRVIRKNSNTERKFQEIKGDLRK